MGRSSCSVCCKYFLNPLVWLIVASLACSDLAAGIPLRYSADDPMTAEAASGVAGLAGFGAIFLSAFVVFGLFGIKGQGIVIHADLKGSCDKTALQNIEKRYGTASVAIFLADAGMVLSGLSAVVNAIFVGTNVASKYKTNNQALLANPWLVTVLVISAIANMSGFILFNVLGARNGFLLVEKHSAEIKVKDNLIKELEGRVVMPVPSATEHNSTDVGSAPFHSAAGALVQDRASPLPAGEAVLANDTSPLS